MKKYILISIIILLAVKSNSQVKSYVDININSILVDFSELNFHIGEEYPELGYHLQEFKFGYSLVSDKASLGVLASIFGSYNSKTTQKQTVFKGYGLSLNYAYKLINKPTIELFPEVVLGFRKFNLILGETKNSVSIEDVLNNSIDNYKFSNTGMHLDLGFGFFKYFNIFKSNAGIGVSSGYRFDFGNWQYEGINSIYNDISNLSGVYVSINLRNMIP